MSFLKRLFGSKSAPASAPSVPSSQMHAQPQSQSHLSSRPSQQAAAAQNTTRRELLRVVLRDTLNRHGIPASWISADVLASTSRGGERGVHWRMVVKHWDPRLLTHGIAIQNALIKRVMTFDPLASAWLSGISWQFALEDESECPPLPHPGVWTSVPHAPHTIAQPAAPLDNGGDVIQGPVHIGAAPKAQETGEGAKADLERLLAVRDADFKNNGGTEATQPMWLGTEPAPLASRP
jgi:hypothetical protein